MLTRLDGLPDDVVGVEATGKVTDEDYASVLVPAVRDARSAHDKVRLVYVLGEGFDGWTMGAVWEDAKVAMGDLAAWQKIAVVGGPDWVRHTVKAFDWMLPGEVRVFDLADRDAALEWAAS